MKVVRHPADGMYGGTGRFKYLAAEKFERAPMLRVGWWPVRILDFPRMQVGAIALAGGAGLVAVAAVTEWTPWRAGVAAAFGAAAIWQFAQMAPYTRLWRQEAAPMLQQSADAVTLLIINLDYRNTEHGAMERMIRQVDPDLLLLVELDAAWERALAGVSGGYPWRLGVTRDRGLGLALWSRLRLEEGQVRHLVHEDRASLWGALELPDGRTAEFAGVHPTPPGLPQRSAREDDRHDSRIRDAELVLVARAIAERQDRAWLVAGDFNDVAWSHTTRLFKRLSGLRDPRIGRGLLNTYHARRPLLRYPLDHAFCSSGFRVGALERIRAPGSDHFAVRLHIELGREDGTAPEADGADRAEAREMVAEGLDDAREAESG